MKLHGEMDKKKDLVPRPSPCSFLEGQQRFPDRIPLFMLIRPSSNFSNFIFCRSVVVANAGDCRAVLCRNGKAFELSCDHKPFSPSEKARIVAAKGTVDGDGYLNGQLSVARALGNWHLEVIPL